MNYIQNQSQSIFDPSPQKSQHKSVRNTTYIVRLTRFSVSLVTKIEKQNFQTMTPTTSTVKLQPAFLKLAMINVIENNMQVGGGQVIITESFSSLQKNKFVCNSGYLHINYETGHRSMFPPMLLFYQRPIFFFSSGDMLIVYRTIWLPNQQHLARREISAF